MRRVILFLLSASVLLLPACGGRSAGRADDGEEPMLSATNLMDEASLLRLYDEGEFMRAEIVNPWDTSRFLGRYVLVERGVEPDSLPKGYVRIDVPLERSLVYSSVHAGIIEELGAGAAVAGVADGEYFVREPFAGRIARGEVRNIGSSMSPSLENVLALAPDAILLSPFENAAHGVIDDAGIPVIECADYMESTPKGRAEWMKLFGVLYGRYPQADSIYSEVAQSYDELVEAASNAEDKPVVLTEMLNNGYWFVPGGGSYMARMLQDAGAEYPWKNDSSTGSLQLDFSSVYAKAADADFWLIRVFGKDLTLDDLTSVYLLNNQFKAFKNRQVYAANTAEVPLFDEFPFHPEKLLRDYILIFHPALLPDATTAYYKKVR